METTKKQTIQIDFSKYCVGNKDVLGNTITKVFVKYDDFVIYEIQTKILSESIRIQIDEIGDRKPKENDCFPAVRKAFAEIKGLLYKVNDDSSIKSRIAHILSHALNGKADEANEQFKALKDEINEEYANQIRHRLKYLITTLGMTCLAIIVSILVYYYNLFDSLSEIRKLIFITTAGNIGGFISVSRRLRNIVFEKGVSQLLYVFYGIERIFIAICGAIIVYFAIKSNLIFGIVNELSQPIFGYLIFAIVAGFSETLVPNLLIKIENENK